MKNHWIAYLPTFIRVRMEGRPYLQRILGNAGWLFVDKILRGGIGLLIIEVWVARYLGPELFGALNFAIAFVALFKALASLGLDGIVVRDLVREPERRHEILSSAFVLKLSGGCAALCLALCTIFIVRPAESQTHWLVAIIGAGMIFESFDAIDLWFQSQVQSKYTVLAQNGAFLMIVVVKVLLILNKAPVIAFAYAALAEVFLGAVGLIVFFLRRPGRPVWRPRKETARRLICESWPAIVSSLAIMIYMRIDQVMLSQMAGNREVGLYSAALRFSEAWYFIPGIIVTSVMPALTRAKQESEALFLSRIQQLIKNLVRVAFAIALPITFVSNLLTTLFYGQAYKGAGTILAIHIWAAVFVFIGVGSSPWFINEGLLKYSLWQTVGGAIINVGLNVLLIPPYGAVGAAIATVVAYGSASFALNALFRRTRVVFLLQLKSLLQISK